MRQVILSRTSRNQKRFSRKDAKARRKTFFCFASLGGFASLREPVFVLI
jgi:hypothetical protein